VSAGETPETILSQYPLLRPEQTPAAIAYAAAPAYERVVPIPRVGMRFKLDENVPLAAREPLTE